VTNVDRAAIIASDVTAAFIKNVVPSAEPEAWLRKQQLIRGDKPTVAGVLLFADEPQALVPKRCGIKIYRYKTQEAEGFRDALAFDPITVEGCLYDQIKESVRRTKEIVEAISRMGEEALEHITYPPETLHEIITNALIHRDYSVADDVHIRIFDNRIEIQSPGRLPAHITVKNILAERFARNGAVVRILNKFPDPPNKDVGEGLNTAFAKMNELGLKEPTIQELENNVLVVIKHEPLASPEEAIMDYLESHDIINNRQARKITHISADYRVKSIFGRMQEKGMIEQVPGTRTSNTAYRKPAGHIRVGQED
jgi:ATP-dependent DNA helicase RecG